MSDKSDNEDIFIKVDSKPNPKPSKKQRKTNPKTEEQKNRIAEILAAGRAKRAEKLAKAKSEKISSSMNEAEIRKLIEKINNESRREEQAKQESRGGCSKATTNSAECCAPSPREEPAKQEPIKQEPIKQEPIKQEPIIDTQAEARASQAEASQAQAKAQAEAELRRAVELASELRRKNAAKMRLLYGNRFG